MFENIRRYVTLIGGIIRPKQLIYFIDGVAPKAKMNQQRTHGFAPPRILSRADQEAQRGRAPAWQGGSGAGLPAGRHPLGIYNVITPGTEFMERVSNMLRGYIVDSLCNDPLWLT